MRGVAQLVKCSSCKQTDLGSIPGSYRKKAGWNQVSLSRWLLKVLTAESDSWSSISGM